MGIKTGDHRHPMKPKPHSRSAVLTVLGMIGLFGGAVVGGLFLAWKLIQRGDRTDVGDLAALASVQAQLRAVDACGIEYNMFQKSHARQMHRRTVFITACEDRRTFPWSGKVKIPDSWAHDALAFEAVRSSKEEAWSILVDPQAVSFPVLVAGLGELTPIVVRDAAAALAQARAEEAQGEAQLNETQRRRQQAQESNQNSYPAQ